MNVRTGEVREEKEELSRIHEAASAAGNVATATEQAQEHGAPFVQAAREEAEMKAAIVLAKKFPRDESEGYTRIMRTCDRPSFAEGANYAFPRGGQVVTGPSVDLARELARIWGNIRYGLRIVTEDDERVHIKGYAYDLESNTYVESEDKFAKRVQRRNKVTRQTEWVKPDERDLRELVNKRGAICVRNAILQLLPSDIVMDAMARCRDTVQKAAKGEIQQDREAAIRRLALAYHDIGVNSEMIASYLKHPMELITNEEIADLRAIYKSIRDGNSRREEYFVLPAYSYGRPGEERAQSLSPRENDRQQRQTSYAEQGRRSSPPEPASSSQDRGTASQPPQPRLQPFQRVESSQESTAADNQQPPHRRQQSRELQPQPLKRPATGLFQNQPNTEEGTGDRGQGTAGREREEERARGRDEETRRAPAKAEGQKRQEPDWDRVPELNLDEVEVRQQPAQSRPKDPAPQKSGNVKPARQRPVSNDPAMQNARKNMEQTLEKARQQMPKPAGRGESDELEPWQDVAEQAADRWDTDDDSAVLRRLNRAAVALFQTPLKKLSSEQLAQILTRVNEGEINLNS